MSKQPDLPGDGAATRINGDEGPKMRHLVVDDHHSYAAGLKLLLEAWADGRSVVAVALNAESVLEQVAQHLPDVVLMDIRMPFREGIEAAAKITATCDEFAVSASTLKRQLAQDQRKLQVDNRVQAVVKAARKGLI